MGGQAGRGRGMQENEEDPILVAMTTQLFYRSCRQTRLRERERESARAPRLLRQCGAVALRSDVGVCALLCQQACDKAKRRVGARALASGRRRHFPPTPTPPPELCAWLHGPRARTVTNTFRKSNGQGLVQASERATRPACRRRPPPAQSRRRRRGPAAVGRIRNRLS